MKVLKLLKIRVLLELLQIWFRNEVSGRRLVELVRVSSLLVSLRVRVVQSINLNTWVLRVFIYKWRLSFFVIDLSQNFFQRVIDLRNWVGVHLWSFAPPRGCFHLTWWLQISLHLWFHRTRFIMTYLPFMNWLLRVSLEQWRIIFHVFSVRVPFHWASLRCYPSRAFRRSCQTFFIRGSGQFLGLFNKAHFISRDRFRCHWSIISIGGDWHCVPELFSLRESSWLLKIIFQIGKGERLLLIMH